MIAEIPLTSDPAQFLTTALDGVRYAIDVRFNSRSEVWSLSIFEEDEETPIILGLPMVLSQDMLEPFNLEIGKLIMVDLTSQGQEATANTLGATQVLIYATPDEVLQ